MTDYQFFKQELIEKFEAEGCCFTAKDIIILSLRFSIAEWLGMCKIDHFILFTVNFIISVYEKAKIALLVDLKHICCAD